MFNTLFSFAWRLFIPPPSVPPGAKFSFGSGQTISWLSINLQIGSRQPAPLLDWTLPQEYSSSDDGGTSFSPRCSKLSTFGIRRFCSQSGGRGRGSALLAGVADVHLLSWVSANCTVKKVIVFPVSSRIFTNRTLPGRELLNYPWPNRVWLVTSQVGTGKW